MRSNLNKIAHILLILLIGGIGVQTITFCSSDDGGDGGEGGGNNGGSSDEDLTAKYCSRTPEPPPVAFPCNDKEIQIGNQIWSKCNLNVVPSTGNHACYCNKPENCEKYGRLYDWATATALPDSCNTSSCWEQISSWHQGICPSGWHIPSYDEWRALRDYIESDKGCTNCAGKYLKATSGWKDLHEKSNGEDSYGFSALPGGSGYPGGNFGRGDFLGFYGTWWSVGFEMYAGGVSEAHAVRMETGMLGDYLWFSKYVKNRLLSVRCVKNFNPDWP